MPGNNYNYGASYIMNADKTSVDKDEGASTLYREKLEFDTRVQTGPMIEAMPKKQTKPTVDLRATYGHGLTTQKTDGFQTNSGGCKRTKTFVESMIPQRSTATARSQRCLSKSPRQKFLLHTDKLSTSCLPIRSFHLS